MNEANIGLMLQNDLFTNNNGNDFEDMAAIANESISLWESFEVEKGEQEEVTSFLSDWDFHV